MIFWSWWLIKHAVNLTMMNEWNVHHVYWWRGYFWVASKKNLFFRVEISLIKSIKLVWDKFYSKTTINSYFSNMKGLYWKSKMVCKKGEEGKKRDISFAIFWENLRADGHFFFLDIHFLAKLHGCKPHFDNCKWNKYIYFRSFEKKSVTFVTVIIAMNVKAISTVITFYYCVEHGKVVETFGDANLRSGFSSFLQIRN